MVLDFSWLPPEINSARIFAGAGSGPLHVAATAWDGLAQDLAASGGSFGLGVVGVVAGPSSASMAAAATPYVGWLTAAAGQAASAAAQARAAASAFETALAATIH